MVADRHPLVERALLGNEGQRLEGRRRHRSAVDRHAAAGRMGQAEQTFEGRRLAGTVWPEQPADGAFRNVQAQVLDGGLRTVVFGQSVDRYRVHVSSGLLPAYQRSRARSKILLTASRSRPRERASRTAPPSTLAPMSSIGASDRVGVNGEIDGEGLDGGELLAGSQRPKRDRSLNLLDQLQVERNPASRVDGEYGGHACSRALSSR